MVAACAPTRREGYGTGALHRRDRPPLALHFEQDAVVAVVAAPRRRGRARSVPPWCIAAAAAARPG